MVTGELVPLPTKTAVSVTLMMPVPASESATLIPEIATVPSSATVGPVAGTVTTGGSFPCKMVIACENSEVFPSESVAVEVTTLPTAKPELKSAVKLTVPVVLVRP